MKQELNQDEATVEQPEVASQETTEATPEVTSTEAKETSERQRTEEEFRKLQGYMTTAINESKKKDELLKSVQTQLQELRRRDQERQSADRKRELESLEGDPDGQASVRRKHRLEDENRELEKANIELMGRVWNKYDKAKALVMEHNLNPDDIFKLMDETTTELEMKLMAKDLRPVEQAKGKVPTKESGFRPDSNTSDAAPSDFKQLQKNFIADPWKYGKQYREALAKRGQ
jgi:hypothetical protein